MPVTLTPSRPSEGPHAVEKIAGRVVSVLFEMRSHIGNGHDILMMAITRQQCALRATCRVADMARPGRLQRSVADTGPVSPFAPASGPGPSSPVPVDPR